MKKLIKYLPTIKFNKYVYAGIVVFFLLLLLGIKIQKDGGIKLGNNLLLLSDYNMSVDLTGENKATYEAEVKKYDELIAAFALGTGKDAGNRTQTELERFLKKAENLAMLGENNQAIKTLNGAFAYYPESPWLMDMLANIYAKAEAYQRALDLYTKLTEIIPDSKMVYAKPIILMHIGLGNEDTAGKLYIDYIKNG
jgi:tetratricopeptide (TPR) repeat protein